MAANIDTRVALIPITPSALLDTLVGRDAGAGAVASFVGQVRDKTDTLESLTLDHYPGMTEKELDRIAREASDRFALTSAMIVHRAGTMVLGDPIVFVGAAAPHRQAALDAVGFMMDFLKTEAPFWKKEVRDGKAKWVDARDSDTNARTRWSQ